MKNNPRINILLAGFTFLMVMSVFMVYSNMRSSFELWGIRLKKNSELDLGLTKTKNQKPDSVHLKKEAVVPSRNDTVHRKILLIGDSEIEGLMQPFCNYCVKNKHECLLSLIWYSSTDKTFAGNDTLKNLISTYKPNYIVMVIGLNQTFQHLDLEESDTAVKKILATFDGIPYSWIGPANWVEDRGINDVYQREVDPGCFYLSKKLALERGRDGRHPNKKGYSIWMDSIAVWMETKALWRLKMQIPDSVVAKKNINFKMLNAAEINQ